MRDWQHSAEHVHQRRWLTLVVLCLSLIVIIVDNSILNVALPTLSRPPAQGGLGATDSDLQWIVDSYVLVFAGLLLTAGSLGDRFGRYRALALGLVVFGLGSGLAAFSGSSGALIVLRAVMGIGGAFIMPATLSIITNVFTEPRERGRAIGVWAGVSALGLALGPVTGGLLLEHFWWGSVLLVNVPIVAVALVGGFLLVPDSRDPAAPRVDVPGAVLSIVGLATVLWGLIEGPTLGWRSPEVLGAFGVGLALLAGFLWWERRTAQPMLDLGFFRNPRFSAASAAITLTFLSLMGVIFVLTQYLQTVLGFSPLKAGAVLLPMSAVMMVLAPLSARVVERVGTKLVLGSGLIVVSAALLLQTTYDESSSTGHVIGLSMLLAVGMANVMAPATESIMGSLPRAKAGVGSAVNDTTRQVGGALGVALLGSLLASVYRQDVRSGLAGSGAPERLVDGASSTVQAGVAAGRATGGELGDRIVTVAQSSFMSGYHLAVVVAAGITLLGAVGVFLWLPARAAEPAPIDVDARTAGDGPAGDGAAAEPVAPTTEGAVG
jgi:EmrB/QacA subfamily drug resistance transporter